MCGLVSASVCVPCQLQSKSEQAHSELVMVAIAQPEERNKTRKEVGNLSFTSSVLLLIFCLCMNTRMLHR